MLVFQAHFTMAHLGALKESKELGANQHKKRLEMIFSEFSDFMVTIAMLFLRIIIIAPTFASDFKTLGTSRY